MPPELILLDAPLASLEALDTDALLVPVCPGDGPQWASAVARSVNESVQGQLTHDLAYFSHLKWNSGDVLIQRIPCDKSDQPHFVVLVGMGDPEKATARGFRRAFAAGFRQAQAAGIKSVAAVVESCPHSFADGSEPTPGNMACWLAEAALLATYRFEQRRTEASKKPNPLQRIVLGSLVNDNYDDILAGFKRGKIEADATCLARDWVFDSANHTTPTVLKNFAEKDLADGGLRVTTLTLEDLRAMGAGCFYSVAKGSDEPAYLVHASYTPQGVAPKRRVALIGKGLTFDSGGLSLKPAKSMELMKLDMAGAAAVLATMHALTKLRAAGIELPLQVDGFVGLCENMPSARASKPGDIVTTLNGKMVEINNTDAEGRLVLADVITYAQRTADPEVMIDLATLTGAQVVALGEAAAAILSPNETLQAEVIAAGKIAGETFWPLPLLDEYKEALKSDVADLINANSGGKAGTANGALFLKEFVDDHRQWAHLDIAGPAYTSTDVPEVPKGATGFGVRTLLHYLLSLAN